MIAYRTCCPGGATRLWWAKKWSRTTKRNIIALTQILLTNLLTDLPEMAIAMDRVDNELVARPRRWDINFVRKFMIIFGLVISVFDYLTFGALLFLLNANLYQFRTSWFVESVVSASLIVLVIRTRQSFFVSKPGTVLLASTVVVALLTLFLPYAELGRPFGFMPMSFEFLLILGGFFSFMSLQWKQRKRFSTEESDSDLTSFYDPNEIALTVT